MLHAFHSNWTRPFFARNPDGEYAVEPFELLTSALSALAWRRENGPIRMICDTQAQRYYDALGLSFLWDGGVHPLLPSRRISTPWRSGPRASCTRCPPCPRPA